MKLGRRCNSGVPGSDLSHRFAHWKRPSKGCLIFTFIHSRIGFGDQMMTLASLGEGARRGLSSSSRASHIDGSNVRTASVQAFHSTHQAQ